MTRHGFRHVLVTDNGRLVGVVSEKDLFTLQRVGLRQVSATIRNAADIDTLKQAAGDIPPTRPQHAGARGRGGTADAIHLDVQRCADRASSTSNTPPPASNGAVLACLRHRGPLRTDPQHRSGQRHRIRGAERPDGGVRAQLLAAAERSTTSSTPAVFRCARAMSWPATRSGALAQRVEGSIQQLDRQGEPDALLKATIFFDFRSLFGNHQPAQALRDWLIEKVSANPR